MFYFKTTQVLYGSKIEHNSYIGVAAILTICLRI